MGAEALVDKVLDKAAKTPTRPGSQWATGKRRAGSRKAEKPGFARGARVK